jgi:S-adenosylmethionine:tRNA ribosyltransferase-isomerase
MASPVTSPPVVDAGAGAHSTESVPAELRTSAYDYVLPPHAIATRPPRERDQARLLVLARSSREGSDPRADEPALEHGRFADLPRYLRPGDCLVLNETRVVKARLYGRRADSAGRVELLLLREVAAGEWEALGRPGKRLLRGVRLELGDGAIRGEILEVGAGGQRRVRLAGNEPLPALLERVGRVPIPPYLGREDDARDVTDYQTVYGRIPGGVAAPTAGLHFTPELLARIEAAGVAIARLVLHPGPGTFRPVETEDLRQHVLDPEPYVLPADQAAVITAARDRGGRVVAVGTTVVRTLEARALAAARTGSEDLILPGEGTTDLYIHPPFAFRVVDALITNFHLPKSTLLMLASAFAGRERLLAAYREAVAAGYLFYSYGDAMLIQ